MTKREYIEAMAFAEFATCTLDPCRLDSLHPDNLPRGGIIGSVILADCARRGGAVSPWFQGPYGFVLRDPKPLDFLPFKGQLGFFDVPGVEP